MADSAKFAGLAKCCFIPQRVMVSLFGFLGIINAYNMRICLSIAITRIVVPINRTGGNSEDVCPPTYKNTTAFVGGNYEWDEQLQGLILSSFYIGYIISHIPAGILADRIGPKWILFSGMLVSVVLTILCPMIIVFGGPYALIAARIVMGVGQGVIFPTISVFLSSWVPASERGLLGALILGGGQIGTIYSTALSGVIIHFFNWQLVFYYFGFSALLWCLFFVLLCYNSPREHPCIKESELQYLEREINYQNMTNKKTPWRSLFTSMPMIALIFAQVGHDWGFYVVVTDLPKYMDQVMRFDIQSNGFYSSLPHLLMWIVSMISGYVSDVLIKRNIFKVTPMRQFMTGVAAIGPGVFLVLASYGGCNHILVVSLFTIAMGLMGTFYAGMKLTPIDIAPNFAGIISAISNGIGALSGAIAPFLVGLMAPDATLIQWRIVFWLACIVLTVTCIPFFIWGSGEVQPFNEYTSGDEKKDRN